MKLLDTWRRTLEIFTLKIKFNSWNKNKMMASGWISSKNGLATAYEIDFSSRN